MFTPMHHRRPWLALVVSLNILSCAWSFTTHIVSRVPRAPTSSTTLIQYADDQTPTPFSKPVPSSPYETMKNDDEVEADHDETTVTATPTPPQTTRKTTTNKKKNNNKTNKKADFKPKVPEITLYELLGVAPTATREELKLRYNALARRYHPDAVRLRPKLLFVGTPTPTLQSEPDFGEIAAAWKLLSDETARRKYDRSLLYKRWADKASNFAFKTMEDAAPVMAKMMDDVAIPLFEKTAQSTVTMARAAYRAGKSMTPTNDAAKTKEPPMTPPTDPVGTVSMDEVVSKIRLPKWNPSTASAEKTPLVSGIPPPTDKDSVQPFFMDKVASPKAKTPKTKPLNAKPPKTKPPKADTMHLLFWTLLKMIVVF